MFRIDAMPIDSIERLSSFTIAFLRGFMLPLVGAATAWLVHDGVDRTAIDAAGPSPRATRDHFLLGALTREVRWA